MGARKHRDLVIRGVTYATAQEAARALGVNEQTVQLAARNGRLDGVGLGQSHPAPVPVRVRGQDFPSARAAAQHFGLHPHAIYNALEQGREDRVGLPRRYNGATSRAITLGALQFPSLAEASRELGFSPGYLSWVLRRGPAASRQKVLAAAMALQARRDAAARSLRQKVAA